MSDIESVEYDDEEEQEAVEVPKTEEDLTKERETRMLTT